MNKSHYTPEGEHPEDRIYNDKEFISRLTMVQNSIFEKLVADLGLNKRGDDLLFGYVFNEDSELSFSEYLEKFNLHYDDYLIEKNGNF